jgi:hypothetical protein
MKLDALVRRIERFSKGNEIQPTLDEFGSLQVSQLLPSLSRLALAGKLYQVDMSAGTAIAPVVAAPVASPQWGLYNASPNQVLIPIKVSVNLESGTAGLGLSIMAATALGPQTVVSADYSGTIKTCLDGSQRTPEMFLTSNPTLIGGTPAWFAIEGTKVNTIATNSVGDTLTAWTEGAYVARPSGGMVAFEVVGETGTTALFDFQCLFAMIEADYYSG